VARKPLTAAFQRTRKDHAAETAEAEAIEDTAIAMRRIVDRELARARTAARTENARADPAQVAERLIAVLKRTPDGARLDWQLDMPEGLAVALHEADLAEALGALAENAARHARARVRLSARAGAGSVRLDVVDDGPGIAPGKRAALQRRHARADVAGSGLGLSIAAEIALAAGGEMTLGEADGGLMARLVLPAAQRGPDRLAGAR